MTEAPAVQGAGSEYARRMRAPSDTARRDASVIECHSIYEWGH